mgnify:FL=1
MPDVRDIWRRAVAESPCPWHQRSGDKGEDEQHFDTKGRRVFLRAGPGGAVT